MSENENLNEVRGENSDESQPCCPSTSDSSSCCSSGSTNCCKSLKIVIFIVVILAACALATHSLLKRGDKANEPQETASSFDTVSLLKEAQGPLQTNAVSEQPSNAAEVLCGITLDSIKSLSRIATEKNANVVFIFLAGENEDSARLASSQIESTIEKLLSNGKQVAAFTLKKNAEGYEQLIQQFTVQSLPCIIVAGKGCGSVAVSGQITETRLLGAFVRASSSSTSCGPQSGSSCSPK